MAPQDEGRFYDLLETLFKEIDQEQVRAEVLAFRGEKPDATREQLADEMTKKAARRVATVGAAAGAAGGPLAILAMAPDIFNLVMQQSRLVLSIAFLFDQKADVNRRFKEVLATLAVATGASGGGLATRVLVAKGLERAAAAKLARKIFGRFLARRVANLAPVLGTIAGGTFNYLAMRAVGKAALAFYSSESR
ncbi:MAG TPA: hypothetical protein VF911_14055 [Thermoanaerobaculia bacterium]|jgi:hypothetical protein